MLLDLGLLAFGAWVAVGGKSLGEAVGVWAGFLSDGQAWLEGRRESTEGPGGKSNMCCFVGNG